MTQLARDITRVVFIGIGATAVMDAWLLLPKRLDVPRLNFAFIGRWMGHLARGTWAHGTIARAEPLRGESALGWLTHYAVGIALAGLLVVISGPGLDEESHGLDVHPGL